MRQGLSAVVLVGLLGAGISGCYSKVTAHEGKFTLAYATAVQYENFVKPIAPGAKLDVVVFANGTVTKMKVQSAKSSRPSVLAVESAKDETIVLKGVAPGVAMLEVTATDAEGKPLTDRMFFHVAKPAKHSLEHACTEDPDAAYVKGEHIDILHNLSTSDDRAVVGYDYAPLKAEPAGSLELTAQPQAWAFYRFKAASARSKVTLRSNVDGKALTMRIVDRGELEDAVLYSSDRMIAGRTAWAVAHVSLGNTAVCNQNALTKAKSLTPKICTASANLDEEPDKDSNREQLITVKALEFGECKYEVILPELAGGKGIVLQGNAKVGRIEFPDDKKSDTPPAPWRVFGYDRDAWSRAGWWLLASRVAALAFVFGWLRGRSTASSASNSSA